MAARRRKRRMKPRFFLIVLVLVALAIGAVFIAKKLGGNDAEAEVTPSPSPTVYITPTPKPTLSSEADVSVSDSAKPGNLGISNEVMENGRARTSYLRSPVLSFGADYTYAAVDGILTFGGNHYRNSFSCGVTTVTQMRLRRHWEYTVGSLGSWSGTGWTGQPLIVHWADDVRPLLGISETYKTKADFTEVIYPAMDGNIYFFELTTGTKTRDPINVGCVIKGTAALDPSGAPLLIVGQGIETTSSSGKNTSYVYAIDLIKNEVVWQFGGLDYFAYRTWQAYDSSPLFCGDTLIIGGENGVLYTVKLNTVLDKEAGTLTLNPDGLVKMSYKGSGYNKSDGAGARWYGIESSVAAWRNYLYFTDNGGRLFCVNVNTMDVVFAVDVGEEADATVVIEEDAAAGTIWLYTASQVRNADSTLGANLGYSRHMKINGLTGEVAWDNRQMASTGDANNPGGTCATPHVGSGNISNLVIYAMNCAVLSCTSAGETAGEGTGTNAAAVTGGKIIAYDRGSGEVRWTVETDADYWSSPVVVYTSTQKGYLIMCDREGTVTMYDAVTSSKLTAVDLGSRIDSTPAVYGDYLIVGTRGKGGSGESAKIICVKIS